MSAGLTVVVDYGLCNLDSMKRALEECGAIDVECTSDPRIVRRADRIVLPGVGSFAAAVRNLKSSGVSEAIYEVLETNKVPFLGACLGMQLMAKRGTEGVASGGVEGLGLIDGEVVRLVPQYPDERIPHMGWNEVRAKYGSTLFAGLSESSDFYFVHSYHICLTNNDYESAWTPYCGRFTAAVEVENRLIFGTQFHPEKSQKSGFQVLKNFLSI